MTVAAGPVGDTGLTVYTVRPAGRTLACAVSAAADDPLTNGIELKAMPARVDGMSTAAAMGVSFMGTGLSFARPQRFTAGRD